MKILALESGGASVAVCALQMLDDGTAQVDAVATFTEVRRLSQSLIHVLQSTLQHANWTLEDVAGLAVGLGPGSWTGLRIGLTTMKTLAQTLELPIAGVPTFDAYAQAAWRQLEDAEHRLLLVTAPCRGEEVYGKIFESHADYLMVAQDEWIATESVMVDALITQAMARGIEASPVVVGASPQLLQHLVESREQPVVMQPTLEAMCVEIALAGAINIVNGEADDALALQPLYIAPSAAERNLNIQV
jgi:tRNA threonylcarbamoyladenosine biosynthesis protein TsaB